jgi:hypothetical protein
MSVLDLFDCTRFACVAVFAALLASPTAAQPMHQCDALGDAGWKVVPTVEVVAEADSAPYQIGAGGDWFVDHTTTVLPMCNYYNGVGNYSLRSYSLKPEQQTKRIGICQSAASETTVPVPPYRGPCPPR